MCVAHHAEKILAAWNVADPAGFEFELENAWSSCQQTVPANYLEVEQRELLESVVEQLRSVTTARQTVASNARTDDALGAAQSLNAGFALLQHLKQRAAA